ncbi:hypothetical protein HHK36_007469 [Tetracentron sinense]|uniref:Uncharacterized protein n=1 Tax=Tetracentron sinense TaxID=13715 RepID=A0A834ZIY8_TETSI|nr:hypothetical protein HHK36_007469 [Tetracentron sinense]
MKKKLEPEEHELQILKTVAQAWHGHSGNTRPTNEYDAYRRNFMRKPTRFKLEASNKSSKEVVGANWDFGQSLWDSYEIVTLSKRLEAGLVLDLPMSGSEDSSRARKRPREDMLMGFCLSDVDVVFFEWSCDASLLLDSTRRSLYEKKTDMKLWA